MHESTTTYPILLIQKLQLSSAIAIYQGSDQNVSLLIKALRGVWGRSPPDVDKEIIAKGPKILNFTRPIIQKKSVSNFVFFS